jgi:hypothetical protein
LSNKLIEQTANYYTTDIGFLKDNQTLLKEYKPIDSQYVTNSKKYEKILGLWDDIKADTGFKDKYYYVDWDMLEFLNRSDIFLQIMSIYNLASPIISFFIPIIILIVTFLILKIKGLSITIEEYIKVLKTVIQTNAIGKLFFNFTEVSSSEKVYLLVSAAFYLFSIYQNVMVCIRFNSNMIKIHSYFDEIRNYLSHTIQSMENYLNYSTKLDSQKEFNDVLKEKIEKLNYFYHKYYHRE